MSMLEIIHEMEALGTIVIVDTDEHLAEALADITEESAPVYPSALNRAGWGGLQ